MLRLRWCCSRPMDRLPPGTSRAFAAGSGEDLAGPHQGNLQRGRIGGGGTLEWEPGLFTLTGRALVQLELNQDKPPTVVVLLERGMHVEAIEQLPERPFCIRLGAAGADATYLAASTAEDRDTWHEALTQAVARAERGMHGHVSVQEGERDWTERYCVLGDDNSLACFDSVVAVHRARRDVPIKADTVINSEETDLSFRITEASGGQGESFTFKCGSRAEWTRWSTALTERLQAVREQGNPGEPAEVVGPRSAAVRSVDAEQVVRQGALKTRPPAGKSDRPWVPSYYVLTASRLLQLRTPDLSTPPVAAFHLNVNCTVFDTTLCPFSFQLVTTGKVLHAAGCDKEDLAEWTSAIRGCISRCKLDPRDRLVRRAFRQEDEMYEVTFTEKRPLGVVLERAGEWALVKMTQTKESGIEQGSALSAVNGQTVMLLDYTATTDMLVGWQPPLTLAFRRSPFKEGWLYKLKGHPSESSSWKRRYFRLEGGHLRYFDVDVSSSAPRGDIKLMGCSVALLARADVSGQAWCFRLMTGLTTLVMQATSDEEMLSWAVVLYRAVAIANGGGYLLVKERMRLVGQSQEADELGATTSPQLVGAAELSRGAMEQGGGGAVTPTSSPSSLADAVDGRVAAPSPPRSPPDQAALELLPPSPPDRVQEQGSQMHSPTKAEQDEEDDEEDGSAGGGKQGQVGTEQEDARRSPTPRKLPAGVTADSLLAKVADSDTSVGRLTDEQIEGCFRSLNASSGGGDLVRPGHFSQFIRLVTGKQNLFFEMDTFHKHFDLDGDGMVDLSAFKQGVHSLQDKDPQHCVIVGLQAFVADSLMSL